MKGHIQRWVNEKHDVVTAVDIKEAFESYGGVRGCRIAVAEVDVAKAAKPVEWKGISALFNFEFLASGIRAWKAYAIGEGQMFPYEEAGRSLQGPTGLHIIMPLTPLTPLSKPGLEAKHITNLQDLFMCEEEGCVATFRTQGDLQSHMDTGRHVRVTERETVYDLARKEWAEKVTGIQSTHLGETGHARANSHSMSTRKAALQGWALKRQRKGERAIENVKKFLLEKFNRGVTTGKLYFKDQVVIFTVDKKMRPTSRIQQDEPKSLRYRSEGSLLIKTSLKLDLVNAQTSIS